jgi:formylglycine-generating enzyme required for sulfatase activity
VNRLRSWVAPLVVVLAACRRDASPPSDRALATPTSSAAPQQASSATALSSLLTVADAGRPAGARPRAALSPKAGERVPIPAGRFAAGSASGDEGRDPRAEAASFSVALSAYEIDRLPYPNDPAEPPRTDVSQRDASRLCAAKGERLCTELEWEYACKGTTGDAYATGDGWDPLCSRDPTTCGSSFGVLGMGVMREWTSSEVATLEKDEKPLPAVRGAAPGAEATEHRCARRAAVAPPTKARELGFRCCAGPPNGASIAAPKLGPVARKIALDAGQLAEIFATIPQLSSLQSIRYFSDPDDPAAVLKRGKTPQGPPDTEGFTLTTSPLLWNPAPGDEVVVVLGRGAKDSFIVALYRLPDNRYRLASSLLLVNDLGPFTLAYHPEVRERLLWSSCWKCAGEGGAVSLRDGRRVIIVQQ